MSAATPEAAGAALRGTVVEFDERVGLGIVEVSGGAVLVPGDGRYRFHCTQIAGGYRTIAAGTPVRFDVRPGRNGTWEASGVTPTGA